MIGLILEQDQQLNICKTCSQDLPNGERWKNIIKSIDLHQMLTNQNNLGLEKEDTGDLYLNQTLITLSLDQQDQRELIWSTGLRIAPW